MKNTEKTAWIYARIDAPEDIHGILKEQEKELLSYAEQMGLHVVGASSDLGSGTDFERPGLSRLMAAARDGDFEVLLVKGVSRLGRDMEKTIELGSQLHECGVSVLSPLEGEIRLGVFPRDITCPRME